MIGYQHKDARCGVRCLNGGLATSSAGRRLSSTPVSVESEGSLIMRRARRAGSVATAALIVAVMTSCTDGAQPSAPTGTTSTPTLSSPTPTNTTSATTPSATPQSDSEIAATAASTLLRSYFVAVDQVRQDADRPVTDLESVASGTQLTAQKNLLENQRERGLRQLGDTRVIEVTVESVNLDDPATAIVDVCWDVSEVDVVDGSGESVVSPDRKNAGWTRFTVTKAAGQPAPTDGWRVSGGSDLEQEPCVGS